MRARSVLSVLPVVLGCASQSSPRRRWPNPRPQSRAPWPTRKARYCREPRSPSVTRGRDSNERSSAAAPAPSSPHRCRPADSNSGAIVNVATRSGANSLHGEAFDYYRDDRFDSRNYFNPRVDAPNPKSPFNRKQFGFNLGGPIVKNRTFYFFSYEGLRHTQGVDLNSGMLTAAQRAAVTDPVSRRLLQYIPLPEHDRRQRAGAAARLGARAGHHQSVPPSTCATTCGKNDDLHGYYAYQEDHRQEPNAQGNTVPGFGDTRGGHRQI